MKTVMKKLLSLALVAILLVSAVPFQAKATETADPYKIPVTVYINGENRSNYNKTLTVKEGETLYLTEELALSLLKNSDGRTLDHWASSNKSNIPAGEDLPYSWLKENYPEGDYQLSLYIKEDVVPEHKHSYTEKVTKEATCTEDGTKVFTCECGDFYEEAIKAPGSHKWGETTLNTTTGKNEHKCTACGATESWDATNDGAETVTFIAGDNKYTRTFVKHTNVSGLPGGPDLKGYKFKGWFSGKNGTGDGLSDGDEWTGKHYTYYAYYVESTDDNISTLSVYARFYVGGVQKGNPVHLYDQDFTDGVSMLKWLNNNETTTSNAIFKVVSAEDYEWAPRYYYNYSGNEPLAEQNLVADGDKSIVVKVYAKKTTQANVLLYVHQYSSTSKTYVTKSIHEMSGYTAGVTVPKSAVDTIVKKNYTGKNMTITGLYTDAAWEQLLAGQNPSAANGIKVSDDGITKIHVILKNGTASGTTTSTADKTNPKTGDMIMVPVMVMVASAAAAAFVYMNSKKRAR